MLFAHHVVSPTYAHKGYDLGKKDIIDNDCSLSNRYIRSFILFLLSVHRKCICVSTIIFPQRVWFMATIPHTKGKGFHLHTEPRYTKSKGVLKLYTHFIQSMFQNLWICVYFTQINYMNSVLVTQLVKSSRLQRKSISSSFTANMRDNRLSHRTRWFRKRFYFA